MSALYYILFLHFAWASYVLVVNWNINQKHQFDYNFLHHLMGFAINFFGCPFFILFACYVEWGKENTMFDVIYKKYFQ